MNTYTEIAAKLQEWLEDDDEEFAGSIVDVINLGEIRLTRDLDLSIFDEVVPVDTAVGVPAVVKPAGYADSDVLGLRHMRYSVAGRTHFTIRRSRDFIEDFNTTEIDDRGPPQYYCEPDTSVFILAPVPDAIYTLNLTFQTRPQKLSVMNETNWLSLNAADILFRACLAEAEGFLKSDDRKPIWEQDYMMRLPAVRRELYGLAQARYTQLGMSPMIKPHGVE